MTEAVIMAIASLLGIADGIIRPILASANQESRTRLIKLAAEAETGVRSKQAVVNDMESIINSIDASSRYRGNDDAGRQSDRKARKEAVEKRKTAQNEVAYANQKLLAYNQQNPDTVHKVRLDTLQKSVEEVKI